MLVESDALCLHPYRKKIMNSEELEYSTPVIEERGLKSPESREELEDFCGSACMKNGSLNI
jgi:hypothetical protein